MSSTGLSVCGLVPTGSTFRQGHRIGARVRNRYTRESAYGKDSFGSGIKFTRMGFIGNKRVQLFPEPFFQDRVRAEGKDIIGKVVKDDGRVSVQFLEFSLQGVIEYIPFIDTFHDGSHVI